MVEQSLYKKSLSATVDRIPLGTLYGNRYYPHSLRMEVDNNVSCYNSPWMCVISMNKEIIFMLREIEERLYSRVQSQSITALMFTECE